jgi:hypothetical protein
MGTKYSKRRKIDQQFPLQDPPNFTRIGIFGMKTYHLATLSLCGVNDGTNDWLAGSLMVVK